MSKFVTDITISECHRHISSAHKNYWDSDSIIDFHGSSYYI